MELPQGSLLTELNNNAQLICDSSLRTPRSARLKKKSVIAKLVEKKKKNMLLGSDSQQGSLTVLSRECNETSTDQFEDDKKLDSDSPMSRKKEGGHNDNEVVGKKSQTDSTVVRFRNLKVATERSHSLESLRNSSFVPKPPSQPKQNSEETISKGEKRNREPSSSGEEQELEVKKQLLRTDSSTTKSGNWKSQNDELPVDNSSSDELDFEYNSNTDLHLTPVSKTVNRLKSPRSLSSLSPRSLPPVIPNNFSSKALRTKNKIDQSYMPSYFHKDNSFTLSTSENAFPVLTTKDARTRGFLYGSISGGGSLLGAEELQRYFPHRKLHIFVGSWNMGECKVLSAHLLNDFIFPQSCLLVQDFYVIGTQENTMNKKQWEITIQEALGPSHVLFYSVSLGSLHLAVFMRRDLIWFSSIAQEDSVTTRAVTMVRTKGTTGICLTFFGTSFLFLNSHFTASQDKVTDRIHDYTKTIYELKLPRNSIGWQNISADATAKFESVFWMGDFNFRINQDKTLVEDLLKRISIDNFQNFEDLMHKEQLTELMVEGKIFKGFQEGRINFKPTYKFDVNTNTYDTSNKLRVPSYTDRILFRSRQKNNTICTHYNSVMTLKVSDHKPVYGLFEVCLRPGRDMVDLASGLFNRDVYVAANRRRADYLNALPKSHKYSSICSIQ